MHLVGYNVAVSITTVPGISSVKIIYTYLLIIIFRFVSFGFVSFHSPDLFYLLTVGIEVVLFSLDDTQTHTTVGRTPLDE
jgi:hypothetical protein